MDRPDAPEPVHAPAGAPGFAWDWPSAFRGATYAIPAVATAPFNLPAALALAVGVLPAAIAGMEPNRRARSKTIILGGLAAVPLFLGSLLAQIPWLAVCAVFALCVGAAVLAAGRPFGQVALALCLPMLGVGLSYSDLSESAGLALLLFVGSVYAYLVSLPWPNASRPAAAHAAALPPRQMMLGYGIRLGTAAAVAAAIGFAFDFDHVGWACAAVLLVMRPSPTLDLTRGVDRFVSVLIGASCAVAVIRVDAPDVIVGLAAGIAVIAAAATNRSRWYLAGTFTTFVVFLLLLSPSPQDARDRFVERLGETLLGVGLAVLFGVLVPMLLRRRNHPDGRWPIRSGSSEVSQRLSQARPGCVQPSALPPIAVPGGFDGHAEREVTSTITRETPTPCSRRTCVRA